MFPRTLLTATLLACTITALRAADPPRKTSVSIVADAFHINGQPTYAGRTLQGHNIEGLLLNSRMATDAGIPQDELRTGSTLILTIVGLWVLIVLSRPIDGWKILIIGSMMLGLVGVYAIPFISDFLQFTDP